jgi:eukaryotic-like serine/threonine-protein kinase
VISSLLVSASSSAEDASSGGVGASHLGRYELICEIAKAQLGALWAGAADGNALFVRRVALGTPLTAALHERLSDAARWAASARLAGFTPVLDVVAASEEIGVFSEYRDGESLRALLRQASFKRTPLPLGVALRIALDVINGLEAAEGLERVTPASLWPDSVIVGTDGITSLLDLGVASVIAADPAWSAHPELASYSAPEKLEDPSSASSRSDVFVVGILLWEMLANQRLFTGLSAPAARQKVLTAPISRLDASKIGSAVSSDLADVVERALDRTPSARFFDVTELRAAIQETGEAIAEPAEVGAALTQISGSLLGIRRRALDKALISSAHSAKTAPVPVEMLQKLRGAAASTTLLGVAPLASGSAPSPSSSPTSTTVPIGSALLDDEPLPKRPLPPPPPPPPRPPTRSLTPGNGAGQSAEPRALAGLEPDADEQLLDDLLDDVKHLPKLTPPAPAMTLGMTAPLGTMSSSVPPDSVDALLQNTRSRPPAPPPPRSAPPPIGQTAPLGTDAAAIFGLGGPPPPPPAPSSFPPAGFAAQPAAQPASDPPPGPNPVNLRRNRKIVIGVVAAMALLLTVAIVIGAVRSLGGDKDAGGARSTKAAAATPKRDATEKPKAESKTAGGPAKAAAPKSAAKAKTDTAPSKNEKEEPAPTAAKSSLAQRSASAKPAKPLLAKTKAKPAVKKPAAKAKKPVAKAKPKAKPGKAAKKPAPKKKPASKTVAAKKQR